MEKYIKHANVILKHKWFVGLECFKRGLYWQGITHDLSKFSPVEFFTSAKYFQGDRSPIEVEKNELGYSIAWLNHKAKNKHHWLYWTDVVNGQFVGVKMPEKYIQEMLCDYIGAGKAYSKTAWSKQSPLHYYKTTDSARMVIHPETRKRFEELLNEYAQGA